MVLKKKMGFVFDEFYSDTTTKPEDLYMSLTQNSSPSVAQEAVITGWETVQTTIRIMGCYGAFQSHSYRQ
jgi:hypothetical protein